jgi:hypothetical protein
MIGIEHFIGLGLGIQELLNGLADGSGSFEIQKHLAEFPIQGVVAGRVERGKSRDEMLAGVCSRFVEADKDQSICTEKIELLLKGEFLEIQLIQLGQDFGRNGLVAFASHGNGTFNDGDRTLFFPVQFSPEV